MSTTDRLALLDECTEHVKQIVRAAWHLGLQLGLTCKALQTVTEPDWEALNTQFAELRVCRQWLRDHPDALAMFEGQRPDCITFAVAKFSSWHHAFVESFALDVDASPLQLHLGTSADLAGKHTFEPAVLDWRYPDLGLPDATGLDRNRARAWARVQYLADEDSNPMADLGISPRIRVTRWSGPGWARLAEVAPQIHLPALDGEKSYVKEHRDANIGRVEEWSLPLSGDEWKAIFGDDSRTTAIKRLKKMGNSAKKEAGGWERWQMNLRVHPEYKQAVESMLASRPNRRAIKKGKTKRKTT